MDTFSYDQSLIRVRLASSSLRSSQSFFVQITETRVSLALLLLHLDLLPYTYTNEVGYFLDRVEETPY